MVGFVAATTGPLGVVVLWRDSTSLERAGDARRPAWPRYVLAATAVAVGISIAWEGDGSLIAAIGEAGAALAEAVAPVGLYSLFRRRRAIRSTERD